MRHASPRPDRRASARTVTRWAAACVIMSLAACLLGCGDGSSGLATAGPDGTAATTPGGTTSTSPAGNEGWRALANEIMATWTDALSELNLLLDGMPAPSAVDSEVRELKERYVQELVGLGRAKEALDASEKASVDSRLRSAMDSLGNDAVYRTYADTYDAYVETDAGIDFYNLLASFNILTQYADFSLLRVQAPEEAARLGIE